MTSPLSDVFLNALKNHFSGVEAGMRPQELLSAREAFLPQIHYSWYEEALQQVTPIEKALLMTAIPRHAAEKLTAAPPEPLPFSDLYAPKLASLMGLYDYQPFPLIDKGPFQSLLHYSKEELTELISLLPLPLLAPQIKKIVDKKRLVMLYNLLTDAQKTLLKQVLLKPEIGNLIGFNFSTWTGTVGELEMTLHKSGIQLLSLGLKDQGDTFRFYLSRILDRGRGKVFLEDSKVQLAKDPKNLLIAVIKYHDNQKKPRDKLKT